jgi:hypothetical protein
MEDHVDHSPDNREEQDEEDPCQLVPVFLLFVENIKAYDDAEGAQHIIDIPENKAGAGCKEQDENKLDQKDRDNENPLPENNPDPFLLHALSHFLKFP